MANNNGRAALILGECWGKVNDNLTSHMAKFLKNDFAVNYLCPDIKDGDIEDALNNGITIIPPEPPQGVSQSPELTWLLLHESYFPSLRDIKDVKLVIGHSPNTEQAALRIRNKFFSTSAFIPFYDSYPIEETLDNIVEMLKEASGAVFLGHQIEDHYNKHVLYKNSIVTDYVVYLPKPEEINSLESKPNFSEDERRVFTYLPQKFVMTKSKELELSALAMGKAANSYKDFGTKVVWVVYENSNLINFSKELEQYLYEKSCSKHLQIDIYSSKSSFDTAAAMNLCNLGLFCILPECYNSVSCAINAINSSLPLIFCDRTNLSVFLKKEGYTHSDYNLVTLPTNYSTDTVLQSAADDLKVNILQKLNKQNTASEKADLLKKLICQSSSSGIIDKLHHNLRDWFHHHSTSTTDSKESTKVLDSQVSLRDNASSSQLPTSENMTRERISPTFQGGEKQDQINQDKNIVAAMELTIHHVKGGKTHFKINPIALQYPEGLVKVIQSVLPNGADIQGSPKSKCIRFVVTFISVGAIDETWELCQNGTIARSFEKFFNKYLKEKHGYEKTVSLIASMNTKKYLHCRKLLIFGVNSLAKTSSQEGINEESGIFVLSHCYPDLEPIDLATSIPNSPFWRSKQAATKQWLQQEWKTKQTKRLQQLQQISSIKQEKEHHPEKQTLRQLGKKEKETKITKINSKAMAKAMANSNQRPGILSTDPILFQSQPFPSFEQPQELGYFSKDSQRNLHSDKRQLRYFYPPERDQPVRFDLNLGFDTYICYDDTSTIRQPLADPLTWIMSKKGSSKDSDASNYLKTDFVTQRGHLTKIMCTPYDNENWLMAVTRFRDVFYVSEMDTEEKRSRRENESDREKKMSYWGYKFEQYLTSFDDNEPPNLEEPVNSNEAYLTAIRTKLNQHRLLYTAEVDCCVGQGHPDYEKASPANYIELKTNRLIENFKQKRNFSRYKLLKWWAQSFLAGVPYVTAGFRDDNGIVREVKTYRTSDIPREAQNPAKTWDDKVCLNFCDQFLQFVKKEVTIDDSKLVYLFKFDAQAKEVTYTKHQNSDYSFIPDWYVEGRRPPRLA